MQASSDFIDEMKHNEMLSRNHIMITPKTMKYIRDFSTFMAIIINLLVLIFKKFDTDLKTIMFDETVARVCDGISIF
jgi:hypothetical protein